MPKESICRRDGNVQKHTGLHQWIIYDTHITASMEIQVKYYQLFRNSAQHTLFTLQCLSVCLCSGMFLSRTLRLWHHSSLPFHVLTRKVRGTGCLLVLTSHMGPFLLSSGRTISTDEKPWCERVLVSLCATHQIFKLSLPSAALLSSETPFLSRCCYFSTRTPSSKSRLALQRTFSFLSDTNEEPLLIISPFSQEYPNINMDLGKICIFLELLSLRVNPCLWLCLVTLPPTDSDQPLISSHPHHNFGIEATVWLNKNMFILFSLFDWPPSCFGFY